MSTNVTELFKQASELLEGDRAELAALLLASLEKEAEEGVEDRPGPQRLNGASRNWIPEP